MSTVDRQYALMLRLLFDAEARQQLDEDPAALLDEAGLGGAGGAIFRTLDQQGLAIDAALRRRYLMSALCRSYPLSSAAIGSAPGGADRLSAFLVSPALRGGLGARSLAFGDHLARLIEHGVFGDKRVERFLAAVLGFERGLVDNAARIRAAVGRGEEVPAPERYSAELADARRPALPPYTVVAQLPSSPAVLGLALGRVGPEDAWHRIEGGQLDPDRVRTVARAEPAPVTLIARGLVLGQAGDRAGGLAPLIEVSHRTVELAGLQASRLALFDGSRTLSSLPEASQRLARRLIAAGVLAAG